MKSMMFALVCMSFLAGCAIAKYSVKYSDGTEYKAFSGGFFKEPEISNAVVTIGTNAVFKVDSYKSKQEAAQSIINNLAEKAAAKL